MSASSECSPPGHPQSPGPPPRSTARRPAATTAGAGRPRALDDAKRREICALVAGGCRLREAARYVRCSLKTIRREVERNADFQEQLSRAEMYAQLSPLRAMQQACATHWRAAAWMLERAYPKRFARRDPAAFGPQQARRLLHDVLDIVGGEVADTLQFERIEKRLRAAFEYALRIACDQQRSSRDLRRAMDFFEQKAPPDDPLAQLGFPTPDLDTLLNALPSSRAAAPPHSSPAAPPAGPQSAGSVVDPAEALRSSLNDLADQLASISSPESSRAAPRTDNIH